MRRLLEIEDIEELRTMEGIDDVELRDEIRGLRAGDFVKLTFRTETQPFARETLSVRITSIRGRAFRGKLTQGPTLIGLPELRAGSLVRFTAAHIHSIAKKQATRAK